MLRILVFISPFEISISAELSRTWPDERFPSILDRCSARVSTQIIWGPVSGDRCVTPRNPKIFGVILETAPRSHLMTESSPGLMSVKSFIRNLTSFAGRRSIKNTLYCTRTPYDWSTFATWFRRRSSTMSYAMTYRCASSLIALESLGIPSGFHPTPRESVELESPSPGAKSRCTRKSDV